MVLVIAPKLSIFDDVTTGAGDVYSHCSEKDSMFRTQNFLFFFSSIITKKREINDYEAHFFVFIVFIERNRHS